MRVSVLEGWASAGGRVTGTRAGGGSAAAACLGKDSFRISLDFSRGRKAPKTPNAWSCVFFPFLALTFSLLDPRKLSFAKERLWKDSWACKLGIAQLQGKSPICELLPWDVE